MEGRRKHILSELYSVVEFKNKMASTVQYADSARALGVRTDGYYDVYPQL